MKFLVDECVGPTVARLLKLDGHDSISVYDELQGAVDDIVLKKAFDENRILITNDKDFGEMVFRKQQYHCGIILLRLTNQQPTHKITILREIIKNYSQELEHNFIVATDKTIRIIRSFPTH